MSYDEHPQQESPHFGEVEDTICRVKEDAVESPINIKTSTHLILTEQDIPQKLVGFQSIDQMFSSSSIQKQFGKNKLNQQQSQPVLKETNKIIIDGPIKRTFQTIIAKEGKKLNQLAPPSSVTWKQMKPYNKKYTVYQKKVVEFPVEKQEMAFYQVQHIVDFEKKEIEEVKIEVEPKERINYRLQYYPVERKIVHIPHKYALGLDKQTSSRKNILNRVASPDYNKDVQLKRQISEKIILLNPERQKMLNNLPSQQRQQTYYVTSSNYNFESKRKDLMMFDIKLSQLAQKTKYLTHKN